MAAKVDKLQREFIETDSTAHNARHALFLVPVFHKRPNEIQQTTQPQACSVPCPVFVPMIQNAAPIASNFQLTAISL